MNYMWDVGWNQVSGTDDNGSRTNPENYPDICTP